MSGAAAWTLEELEKVAALFAVIVASEAAQNAPCLVERLRARPSAVGRSRGGAEEPYGADTVDWIVGAASTRTLIAELRAPSAKAPILVLTAQMASRLVRETDIAAAIAEHGRVFSEKPVRLSILSATLTRTFATA